MSELLSLRDVSKSYPRGERRIRVLREVCLDISAGEIVAVVASRYEGKTTLLRLAAGIDLAEDGQVSYDGQDLAQLPEHDRARLLGTSIAWTDGSGPAVHLRVLDYVALPLVIGRTCPRRKAEEKAISALERVGAAGCARAGWDELSNYERVLVSLARAICGSPRLLVVDELLDGLGMRRTREASALLASFGRELGCAVLMSASDVEATLVADRVFWFERGRLEPMSTETAGEAQIIDLLAHSRHGEAASGAGS